MSRTYKLYLQDILECCEKIKDYTKDVNFADFSADRKTIDAVVRNLEIIGEAVKNVPNEILQTRSEIDWKKTARFRDLVIHHYFKVDLEIVWDVVQNSLVSLENAVVQILENLH
jgi:uncharacterized protein with HEPN domain